MVGIVVVFDFDRTIIDGDSNKWVVTEMGLTELFQKVRHTIPWDSVMSRMMEELHTKGKTADEIAECLKRAPLHPRITAAIKSAHALGCDLRILSNGLQFFVETILKHHGILGCFSEINTNPTFVDEEGRLTILPYHDFTSSPHGCNLCRSNMCKGLVIERIQASTSDNGKKRFFYLGDGNGDFCPSLKLKEGDHVMPRMNFPLWKRICSSPTVIKAEVHAWSDGEELERVLLHLINTISVEENNIDISSTSQLNSSDCNSQTSPGSTNEAFPHTLPVPH
ncbi:hypothetical protein L1049_022270 [Liquidambar formosana]|uniref:Uncharacterized protein n=1 Tax=Liquidambar formosana TaxID=63359 RepID=A0AAP0RDK5_LIQFO